MDLGLALGIAGIVLSAVGIPITYVYARRARQRPRLAFALDFDVLLNPTDGLVSEGLSLSFRDRAINRVSRTYVALWNDRGDTVRGNDIVDTDPLRVQLAPGDTPLETRILLQSREQSKMVLALDDEAVRIAFDFLDEGDGALIEVLHEGAAKPELTGTVRGATLSARGTGVDLSPAELLWMRDERWWSRLRNRLKRPGISAKRRPRALLPLIAAGLMQVVLLGYIAWDTTHDRRPALIPAQQYDLDTVKGQKHFADDVRERGIEDDDGLILLLLLLAQAGLFVGLIYNTLMGRVHVPRSIVRESGRVASDAEQKP
jgi:hypothetical protein